MNLNKDPESWARVRHDMMDENGTIVEMAIQDIQTMAKEIERLRIGPVIRSLVWKERDHGQGIEADSGFGYSYVVKVASSGEWGVWIDWRSLGYFEFYNRAKEFAQSDFISRVRSAFEGAS